MIIRRIKEVEHTRVFVKKSTACGVAFGNTVANGRLLRKGKELFSRIGAFSLSSSGNLEDYVPNVVARPPTGNSRKLLDSRGPQHVKDKSNLMMIISPWEERATA